MKYKEQLLSPSFAAGVASWAFLGERTVPPFCTPFFAAALSLSTLIMLSMLVAGKTDGRKAAPALLLLCGIWVAVNSSITTCRIQMPEHVTRISDTLKTAISGIPYEKDDTAALVRSLLTGDRSLLDSRTYGLFRNSGASHLLALSGLHIGIVYMLMEKVLKILGNSPEAKRAGGIAGILLCLEFTMITGAGPSVVRAFLFILIREYAVLTHRRISLLKTLDGALVIQLCLNPEEITSPGFQLSYLAMLGIAILHPRISCMYPKNSGTLHKIWELSSLGISCQIFTAPVSWFHFHSFPKYFLITSILTTPVMTAVMLSSVLALASSLTGICTYPAARINELACTLLVRILETISSLP